MKSKRTKAVDITRKTREAVKRRDGDMCIMRCGRRGLPNAHFISRAQNGLGIPENIVTLCFICHARYDSTTDRLVMQADIENYLQKKYPDWDKSKLVYNKFSWLEV